MSADNYTDILLEEIRDQNKLLIEVIGSVQESVQDLPVICMGITELKTDMVVVKAAVTDLSHELRGVEQRVGRLEAA